MATKAIVPVKRPIRQLSVLEKLEAIQRVHNGESKASVARDIGVPESTLRGWCKSEEKLRNVAQSCGTPESQHSDKEVAPEVDCGPSERKKMRGLEEKSAPELDESLWYWLKREQHMSGADKLANGDCDADGSGWFWRWYKRYGFTQYPDPLATAGALHRVNGDPAGARAAVLDSVLLNPRDNNNVSKLEDSDDDDEEDEPPATAAEAVGHGEKFLRWLECCSDPSVTAMQILQFRYLLNNVRACADRRAKQIKTKTRSRRK